MKNHITISIVSILLLQINIGFAQTPVDIGLKAGLGIPNLTSGSAANPINSGYGSRLGLNAAVQVEFHFSKHFSIQPQLEYSEQGGKKNGTQAFAVPTEMQQLFPAGGAPPYLYANYKSVAKINYLMLPVLAKYRIDTRGKWGAYAAAGPFVSLLLSAKNITSGSSAIYLDAKQTQPLPIGNQSFDNTENIKNDLHPFNAGISGHIGFNYKLANGSMFIEGGGNYGFFNIQKDKANGENRTGAAEVTLGYQFRL